jgi:signal transduction histidine kinase
MQRVRIFDANLPHALRRGWHALRTNAHWGSGDFAIMLAHPEPEGGDMLHEFLTANRDELIRRCRAKVAKRPAPTATAIELEHGIPLFLDQLIATLREQLPAPATTAAILLGEIRATATRHGYEFFAKGFSVDQVVHDYGDLCQSVTELAAEYNAPISVTEFRAFNRCLDDAIAEAVTAFGRARDRTISARGAQETNERLGSLAHELRNLLNSAILAFDAIKSGNVAVTGATGAVLDRSLLGLRDVIDRSLAEVRLGAGLDVHRELIDVREFVQELQVAAGMEATARKVMFNVAAIDEGITVDADRQMLGSAVSNLLQNAFKFSRRHGTISLSARAESDRVLIDVADECGGLPDGKADELFRPFEQKSSNRTGLGLGLSISRRAVQANNGTLTVRNVAGRGCIFTIDLPRSDGN